MENQKEFNPQTDLNQISSGDMMEGIKKLSQPVMSQVRGGKTANPKQKSHTELHKENIHFQRNMQSQNAKKAYYIPEGIPVEQPVEESGMVKGCVSVFCALISLVFFPIGIIGIIFGIKARNFGSKGFGTAGVVLSLICMIIGIFLASWHFNTKDATGGVAGLILRPF